MELHGTPLIVRSIPDSGFEGVCSSKGFGHNSSSNSLKTSLIALSMDQASVSGSELEICCTTLSECIFGVSSMVQTGCTVDCMSTA